RAGHRGCRDHRDAGRPHGIPCIPGAGREAGARHRGLLALTHRALGEFFMNEGSDSMGHSGAGAEELASPGHALVRALGACESLARECVALEGDASAGVSCDAATAGGPSEAMQERMTSICEQFALLESALVALGCHPSGHDRGVLEDRLREQEEEVRLLLVKLDEQLRYRQRVNALLERERRKCRAAGNEAEILRNSFSFRLGSLLLGAVRSP